MNLTTRRMFLKFSLGAVAAATVPVLISCQPIFPPGVTEVAGTTATLTPTVVPFRAAKEIISQPIADTQAGLLKTHLLVFNHPSHGHIVFGSPKPGVTDPDPNGNYDRDWDFDTPGPTLRVKPGDTINIMLHNRLTPVPAAEVAACDPAYKSFDPMNPDIHPNCFHNTHVTNIHYHGLHVDQGARADDIFIKLYPKDQPPNNDPQIPLVEGTILCPRAVGDYEYYFQVPPTHPRGTFWYHPHVHGSSAFQSANGLSGALIVEDDLANDPAFYNQPLEEKVLVVQILARDIGRGLGGNFQDGTVLAVNGVPTTGVPVGFFNLTGNQIPEITIRTGQVQRWRIVNASWNAQSSFSIRLPESGLVDVRLIAMDGNFIPLDRWRNQTGSVASFFLAPSNRIDLLVKGVSSGIVPLEAAPVTIEQKAGRRRNSATPGANGAVQQPGSLVSIKVEGSQDTAMDFPVELPTLPTPDLSALTYADVKDRQHLLTIIGEGAGNNPHYKMGWDNRPPTEFDEGVINKHVQVDSAEMWIIQNKSTVAHPFHIHLNPFYIPTDDELAPSGIPSAFVDPADPDLRQWQFNDPRGLWQDSLLVPGAVGDSPGQLVIWQRFPKVILSDGTELPRPYTYVYHCHILGHEDRGFMHVIQVNDSGKDEGPMPAECVIGGHS